MIAEVGFIENVSGSRIAMPLAPPRPGSTPISTPSTMPTSMKRMFGPVSATLKPCRRFWISSMVHSPNIASMGPFGSGTRNQRSNTRKKNSGTPIATPAHSGQPNLPCRRMKNAISTSEAM